MDQNLTTDQNIPVEQNTDIFKDQSNNYNMDDQQDFVYDQELGINGEGADFAGAMDAGGDISDYYVDRLLTPGSFCSEAPAVLTEDNDNIAFPIVRNRPKSPQPTTSVIIKPSSSSPPPPSSKWLLSPSAPA